MSFNYPDIGEAIAIHDALIHELGGSLGIRDEGALASAIMRPQLGYYDSLTEEAAALMESLANNHPFVDGNKRTALAVTEGMYLMSTMNETTGVIQIGSYLVLAGAGIGGTLTVLSVAIQNSVPFSLVGAGTSAGQFWRSVGGMMGLAVMGAVLVQSFRHEVEARVPDKVRAALPAGLIDSVKENPQALLDPAAAEALREFLAEAGSDDPLLMDSLLDSLNVALAGGLSNVFTVLAVAAALSFTVVLFLRVRTDAETEAIGTEADVQNIRSYRNLRHQG